MLGQAEHPFIGMPNSPTAAPATRAAVGAGGRGGAGVDALDKQATTTRPFRAVSEHKPFPKHPAFSQAHHRARFQKHTP